eukprot:267383_1
MSKALDNPLIDFIVSVIIPAFWCCVLYTCVIFSWSSIYFFFNTIPSLHKYKINSPSLGSVIDGSKCCNQTTYFLDMLNTVTDILIALLIIFNTSLATHKHIWIIFGYISTISAFIGILLLITKFNLLSKLYPYINQWRISISKLSNDKQIITKYNQISLFLKHQIMFDLLSASLQDSIQASVILYIFADLSSITSHHSSIYNKLLLYDNDIIIWILRIKLCQCLIFMTYKLLRAIGIQCHCHTDNIKDKYIKYNYFSSDCEYDYDEINEEYQMYFTPKQKTKKIHQVKTLSTSVSDIEIKTQTEKQKHNENECKYDIILEEKKKEENKKSKHRLLSEDLNGYKDIDKQKIYSKVLSDEYNEEWKKNVKLLIEQHKESLQDKTMQNALHNVTNSIVFDETEMNNFNMNKSDNENENKQNEEAKLLNDNDNDEDSVVEIDI